MTLQIKLRQAEDTVIVDLHGRIVMGPQCDELSAKLRKLIEDGTRKLILNLEDVSQVDSSGISILVRTFVTLRRDGGHFALLQPSGRVRQVLEVMRLPLSIPAFDTESAALKNFSP